MKLPLTTIYTVCLVFRKIPPQKAYLVFLSIWCIYETLLLRKSGGNLFKY